MMHVISEEQRESADCRNSCYTSTKPTACEQHEMW